MNRLLPTWKRTSYRILRSNVSSAGRPIVLMSAHPLLPLWLAGAWVVKHVAVYQFAKSYGFARLYRRLMEINRSLAGGGPGRMMNTQQYNAVRDVIQAAFRTPAKAAQFLEENVGVLKVLSEFEKKYLLRENRGWTEAMIYTALKATPLYKAIREYDALVKLKDKKNESHGETK